MKFVDIVEASNFCLDDQLRQWIHQKAKFDVVIRHHPRLETENRFIPFTGNGHIGLALGDDSEELRVRLRRSLSLLTGIRPVIKATLEKTSSSG